MKNSASKFKVAPGLTLFIRDECGFLMSWTKTNGRSVNCCWPDSDSKMLLHFNKKEELRKFILTLEHMFGVVAFDVTNKYPSCVLAVDFKKTKVQRRVLG